MAVSKLAKAVAATFNGGAGAETWDYLVATHYHRPSYVKGDARESDYREGQRSVVIALMNLIAQADPKRVPYAPREVEVAEGEDT